jgi:hypothetical protein
VTLARQFQVESFLSRVALRYPKFDIVFHRYTPNESVTWGVERAATIAHLQRWRSKLPDVRVFVFDKPFWSDDPLDDDNNNNDDNNSAGDEKKQTSKGELHYSGWLRYNRAERPVFLLTDVAMPSAESESESGAASQLAPFDQAFGCAARARGLPLVAFDALLVQGAELAGHVQTPVQSREYTAVLGAVCDALALDIAVDGTTISMRLLL